MTRLSGRVPETGTAIEGVTVAIIDTQGVEDATQWTVVASDTTDGNGEWSVSGLDSSAVERYHAVAQYDDGSAFTNFESLPYLSTPADAFAPTTPLSVGTPTPSVAVGSAIPDGVVDHFEQILYEDDNKTLSDYYSGDIGVATRQQTTVKEGSYALEFTADNDNNNNIGSFDTNGLPNYPSQGDSFRCWFRTDSAQSGQGADTVAIVFGLQDSGDVISDRYRVDYQGTENLRISKQEGGNFTTLVETILTLSSNTWYEFVVDWKTDGTIAAFVYDESGNDLTSGGISATDSSFSSGGVGFVTTVGTSGSHTAHFDNYRLENTATDGGTVESYFYDEGVTQSVHGLVAPESVHSADTNDTHVTLQGADLDPYALTYDHGAGSWSGPTKVGDNPLTDDDHGAPALLRDDNGTLHAFWGLHGIDGSLHHATSDSADDMSSWTLQTNSLLEDNGSVDGTYPLPVKTSTGDIYLFFRRYNSTERNIAYIKSTDNGSTWTNFVDMATWDNGGDSYRLYPTRPYVDANDNIWMTYCYTNGTGTPRFDQYVVYLDTSDDTVRDATGAGFGSTITKADAQDANNDAQAFDSGANPVEIASTTVVNGNPHVMFGYDDGDWDYNHIYWDGSSWTAATEVTPSGNEFNYVTLSDAFSATVEAYLVVSNTNRGGDIERWTFDGTSWTRQEVVLEEANQNYPLGHPQYVENGVSSFKAIMGELDFDSTANDLKAWGHGTDGFVEREW